MRPFPVLVAAAFVSLALAGCVNEEESTDDEGRARGFSVSVPEDVHKLRVEVYARSREDANVRVEVEREDRSNVGEATFDLKNANASRSIEADVTGMDTTWVLVTVSDGDASVNVRVYGVTDSGGSVFLREESYEITMAIRPYSPPTPSQNASVTDETNSS